MTTQHILNENQKKATEINQGPMMILAGAGSGKTRTIVAKVNFLIEDMQIESHKILCLTFSNKAAKEMKERIFHQHPNARHASITTFHSFCAQLLRREYHYLGLGANFTIYDRNDAKSLAKKVLESRGISSKELTPDDFLFTIDEYKNAGLYLGGDDSYRKNDLYPMIEDYESQLLQSHAIDFGGLITNTIKLLRTHPDLALKYQERYSYILVDEYQDTNVAQFELMNLLAKKALHLCVVGDEDQSIYSWRGANIKNILDFGVLYPDTQIIKLEQNYRSTKNIIQAASCVIRRNKDRLDKNMWTENDEGACINIYEFHEDIQEAHYLASHVQELHQGREKVNYSDIAIFYRNNSQSRIIEEYLRRLAVPYKVIGGMEFFQRKEIKDIISYLKLLVNPKDNVSLARIINTPIRGLGAVSLKKMEQQAIDENLSLWDILLKVVNPAEQTVCKLNTKTLNNIQDFVSMIVQGIQFIKEKKSLIEIYEFILKKSTILEFYEKSKDPDIKNKADNLKEFSSAIKNYHDTFVTNNSMTDHPSLQHFLESITLDGDSPNKKSELESSEYVSLMTIHGSKGLEFPYVFLVGLEENIFPSYMTLINLSKNKSAMEEERRLFYVAMTRAMKNLSISYATMRTQFGKSVYNSPSRFIREIPKECYVLHHGYKSQKTNLIKNTTHSTSLRKELTDRKKFPQGAKVMHKIYGAGVVIDSLGFGVNEKALIEFSSSVRKKFVVQHSPLKLL